MTTSKHRRRWQHQATATAHTGTYAAWPDGNDDCDSLIVLAAARHMVMSPARPAAATGKQPRVKNTCTDGVFEPGMRGHAVPAYPRC